MTAIASCISVFVFVTCVYFCSFSFSFRLFFDFSCLLYFFILVFCLYFFFFFFQAEDGIRDHCVTGVQTCALPISSCAGYTKPMTTMCRRIASYRLDTEAILRWHAHESMASGAGCARIVASMSPDRKSVV